MKNKIYKLSEKFWNIRGSFKLNGLIEIGTHCSLVKVSNSEFILLDIIELDDKTLKKVYNLTDNGKFVKSIINLHPFHTVYAPKMIQYFPNANFYGTSRHKKKLKNINWETRTSEELVKNNPYANSIDLAIPEGVDFISENENVHFSSILAYHHQSKTIHVDDTLIYIKLPKLIRLFGIKEYLGFHPTLSKALIDQVDSGDKFRQWVDELAEKWSETQNICAAHSETKIAQSKNFNFKETLKKALAKTESTLTKHKDSFKD